jgi:hypothetical protein
MVYPVVQITKVRCQPAGNVQLCPSSHWTSQKTNMGNQNFLIRSLSRVILATPTKLAHEVVELS